MPDQIPPDHRLPADSISTRDDLADSFADPTYADRESLGHAFADPEVLDDRQLGHAFETTNSSPKKHHKPLKQTMEEPFQKAKGNGILAWFIVAVVVIFLLVLFFGWIPRHNEKKAADQKAKQEQDDPVVEVTKVTRAKDTAGLVVPGTTTPLEEAAIYARASGYLRARYVDIGDRVHKGQLLAIIDAPDLDQQVDQAREQVRQAEAQQAQQETQLALTKVTVDRYRALVERGVFSRQDGDQQEANFQAQRANVASAARNVEAFKANLRRVIALQSYERVTAPFDGVVTQRNVDAGALINAQGASGGTAPTPGQTAGQTTGSITQNASTNSSGSSGTSNNLATPATGGGTQGGPLFAIAKVDQLRILVSVPEGYASAVLPGTPTALHFQEFPNSTFYGNVSRNAAAIDQNTRTLVTEIVIKNTNNKLMSGMYAVATFANPGGPGPIVISGDAIGIRNDRPTVAVIQGDKVKLVPVSIGRDYGPEVEIMSGLKEGDLIASSFTDDVTPGRKIHAHEDEKEQKKQQQANAPAPSTPPGGSTQYADPGITDQDMQGQSAKPKQKSGGGAKKATGDKSGTQ